MALSHPSWSFAKYAMWQSFLDRTISLLRSVEGEIANPATIGSFTIRDGWWLKRQPKVKNGSVRIPSEDAMTDAIEEIAERLLKASRPADPAQEHLAVHTQTKRPPHRRIGPKALKNDIRIRSTVTDELDLRIEAKPLWSNAQLSDTYLGSKGMLRFADPAHPYTDRPVGMMLGYALRDPTPDWKTQTRSGLAAVSHASNVDDIMSAGERIPACDLTWGGEPHQKVCVVHVIMKFETDPASRP
jgi:hypothetical protein